MLLSELTERVRAWAEKRGITVDEAFAEAAEWWVDEQPDIVEAIEVSARIKSGEETTIPLEQVMAELEAPYRRQLIFTPAEDDETGWVVTVPSLPGCVTQGDTLAEAAEHIVEAMEVYIETLEAKGWDAPPDGDIEERITVNLITAYQVYREQAWAQGNTAMDFVEWATQWKREE